jgi:hypothetical protein
MKYFAKYLPVEGEVTPGDYYFQPYQEGQIGIANKDDYMEGAYMEDTKAKLFLCSRDIEVGDKVIRDDGKTGWVTGWNGGFDHVDEWLCVEHEEDINDYPKGEHDFTIFPQRGFKVIGEVSPNATWVKEGDEFDDKDWKDADIMWSIIDESGDEIDRCYLDEMNSPSEYDRLIFRCPSSPKHFH